MKKLSLFFLLFLLPLLAHAHDFEATNADGVTIYYNYNTTSATEVAVTYRGSGYKSYSNEYTGVVNIPATVTYNGTTYSVTSIGGYAFCGCSGLTEVTIPNSVTSIDAYAFDGCSGLSSVTIPNSVTSIGAYAFSGCRGLTEVTIPNSVTSIDSGAFYKCSGLRSVTIPNSITSIDGNVFYGCTRLESVTIPNSVTYIGFWAFGNCASLGSVTIGTSVTSISSEAFYDCTSLKTVYNLSSLNITKGSGDNGYVAYYADNVYTELPSVTVNGIELKMNDTGNGWIVVKYTGTDNDVIIPEEHNGILVVAIGDSAFYGCTSLISVTIPNSVTSIGDEAFCGCSGLTSVTIGNSVTSIGDRAFRNCSGLTEVTIPNSVTSISDSAFWGCYGLTEVTIGNSVTSIGDSAFERCSGLTSVTIPNSVTSIGIWAFLDCSGLTSVTIGNSVTSIGNGAFIGCRGLTSVTIGNSVTSIGNGAFSGCSSLTEVTIPNSVTSIGYSAFYGCSGLTEVTIPDSVTYIGYYAFRGCSGLTEVKVCNPQPENISLGYDVFYSVPTSTCTLYVPKGSKELYAAADVWNEFKNIKEFEDEQENPDNPDNYDNTGRLYINPFEIGPGETKTIEVLLDTPDYDITALQFDLSMPEGLSVATGSNGYLFALTDRTHSTNHILASADKEEANSISVLCYSTSIAIINGRNGAIISFPVVASEDFNGGDIRLSNNKVVEIKPDKSPVVHDYAPVTVPVTASESADTGRFEAQNADGVTIYYKIISSTEVAVYFRGNAYNDYSNEYSGVVNIPATVTHKGVTYSVTSVYDYAFGDCNNLTTVVLPVSVTVIGNFAFHGCSGLTSVNIPDAVTTIGNNAFSGCNGLISITIGKSVTSIGDNAFHGCVNLTTVNFNAQNCITMGSSSAPVFSDCSKLTTINIGGDVTTIPSYAFYGCNKINVVIIPVSITVIGDFAFHGCSGLTSVNIPDAVTTIGNNAFSGCNGLISITIGKSVTSIGDNAFHGCVNLTTLNFNAQNCITMGSSSAPVFSDCSKLTTINIGGDVTTIPSYAFYGCNKINVVIIPVSITVIGDFAFNGCSGLTSVNIPDAVTTIGNNAFSGCNGLISITIGKSVTNIGDNAFHGCVNLTTVNFNAQNCITMGSSSASVFSDCSNLTTINIANNVTTIPSYAFYGCNELKIVYVPVSITIIGNFAFYGCSNLTSVNIPDAVTTIGNNAFSGCDGLTSVTIGKSVTSIGDNAFHGCVNLTTVNFNAQNCITMGSSSAPVFSDCSKLTTINIGGDVTTIPSYAFYGCNEINIVIIPLSITVIGNFSFHGCSDLTSINIPDAVTSIGNNAFSGCDGLTSVTIGKSVTSIGDYAFSNCTSLKEVVINNLIPSNIVLGDKVFMNVTVSVCILYTPAGSGDLYSVASQWKDFQYIVEQYDDSNKLSIENKKTFRNTDFDLVVSMENTDDILSFQCDLVIPEHLKVKDIDGEPDIVLGSRAPRRCNFSASYISNDTIRVVGYSNKIFSGNEGEIFTISFNGTSKAGIHEVRVVNIELTDTDLNCHQARNTSGYVEIIPYTPGDTDGDNEVTITDVVYICNYVMKVPYPLNFVTKAADTNNDGNITIADVVYVVNTILKQSIIKAPARTDDSGALYIDSFTITAGETMDVEIKIDTPDYDVTAFQVDITMPEGLTIEEDGGEYIFDLTDRAPKRSGHQAQSNTLSTGIIRVLCYSSKSVNFDDREGAVLVFPTIAATDFKGGEIELTNIEVVEKDGSKHRLAPVTVKVSETSGVELVGSDNAEAVYYNLQGVRVANPDRGIFIKVTGNKAEKVYVK